MSDSQRPDPANAPHLSSAARRLLTRARQPATTLAATPVLRKKARPDWVLAGLCTTFLGIALLMATVWLVQRAPAAAPAELSLLLPGSDIVVEQPLFTETLPAPADDGAPPLRSSPEPQSARAPALPAQTPTPLPDAKVRPLPWPHVPAPGRPTRIYAPRVGLDAEIQPVGYSIRQMGGFNVRIYEVARWAAGWHTNSSLPGWAGNTVLAGHHNAWGSVFRPALELEPGDFLFVEVGEMTYSYLLVIKETLPETTDAERRANGQWIAQTEDERLTLVTCWPPDGNSHRVVLVAIPAK